ncbi:MAG: serine kinase of the HPr protein regulates carbohydrate metabolism [Acidobacteria bacterium]|nr:serine kinase of the HPr protein regulates carbohydrate metabolism [Acidobacteriota bacterium]
MTTYRWGALAIAADIAFPELPAGAAGDAPLWQFSLSPGRAPRRPRRWFHHWRLPDGRRWVAFARDGSGYLLRFPRLADFQVELETRTIRCYGAAETPLPTIRHLLLDQLLPLVAGGHESLALHGSVVAFDRGAAAFLAGPGYGKSTLAARLAMRGRPLISDDCCLLRRVAGGFEAVPSYPGVRLTPHAIGALFGEHSALFEQVAHYTTKRRVATDAAVPYCTQAVPLARIYVLGEMDELQRAAAVSMRKQTLRAALFDLVNYTFHLDVGYAPRIREAFGLAADIVERHDVRRLVFPWASGAGDLVADAVIADLA